jgi:hypothetical protein
LGQRKRLNNDLSANEASKLTARLLVLGHILGKQRQKHFVPIFVSRRIKLALSDQPSIMLDACVVENSPGMCGVMLLLLGRGP